MTPFLILTDNPLGGERTDQLLRVTKYKHTDGDRDHPPRTWEREAASDGYRGRCLSQSSAVRLSELEEESRCAEILSLCYVGPSPWPLLLPKEPHGTEDGRAQ